MDIESRDKRILATLRKIENANEIMNKLSSIGDSMGVTEWQKVRNRLINDLQQLLAEIDIQLKIAA